MKDLDPITKEIVGNALISASREMGSVMARTSVSSILNEGKDFSCAIFDATGQLSATAEFVMVHLGAMGASVKSALKEIGIENFEPGDIAILNDPYKGGSHLPDVTMVRPVFEGSELIAFVGNRAHYPDVGGMAPGSFAGDSTEIFQEGIIIPPLILYKKDELDEKLFNLILNNVRSPRRWKGDSAAQVASLRLGEKRIHEYVSKWGRNTVVKAIQSLIQQSYDLMKSRIRNLPDGEYKFFDYMDDFGPDGNLVKFYLTTKIHGDQLIFDFGETDMQIERPINCPLAVTQASVYAAIKGLLAPEAIVNAGFFKAVEFITKEGSLVNAAFPAPVCGGNTNSSQRLLDLVLACFAQILPDKVIGAEYACNSDCTLGGYDKRFNENYVIYTMPVGGIGARATKDGVDALINYVGNVSNQPVEVFEHVLPFRYLSYRLRQDSGGPGKFRGGLGEEIEFMPIDHICTMSIFAERVQVPPWGIFKGCSASPAQYMITDKSKGKKTYVEYKTSRIKLTENESFTISTPGGGGYGNPLERAPKKVLNDYYDEKISLIEAEEKYGVMIDPILKKVDEQKTKELRKNKNSYNEAIVFDISNSAGYQIVIPSEMDKSNIHDGDLIEIFSDSIHIRGWVKFSDLLLSNQIIIPRIMANTLKIEKGGQIYYRQVQKGLARNLFSDRRD